MKLNLILCLTAFLLVLNISGFAEPFVLLDADHLAKVKKSLEDDSASPEVKAAYGRLMAYAQGLKQMENPTVTFKKIEPPTGDMNDYLSISRYWWPDPEKEDGLPWIRKDGNTNPSTQTDDVDRNRLGVMTGAVRYLSLAYYLSDNEAYAKKAASILRTWYLDEETRMNPHLQFAQSVPGNPKGRRSGILDGRDTSLYVLDALVLLSDSSHWTEEDNEAMNKWLTEYLEWLTESELGKSGEAQTNNHGSWYNFHVIALAWYLGNESLTNRMIDLTKKSLDYQFNADGGQSHELTRTRSFFYSCFNLDALTKIAIVAEQAGVDLWEYETPDGKSLKLGIDYLIPASKGENWEHPTRDGVQRAHLAPALGRMSARVDSEEYSQLLDDIFAELAIYEKERRHQMSSCDDFALLGQRAF